MKKNNNRTTMTVREVAILVEELKGQFRIFGEDLSAVKAKVEAIFEDQGKLREEIYPIKADIRIMKADLETIKSDIAEIKVTLDVHSKRLTHLEAVK